MYVFRARDRIKMVVEYLSSHSLKGEFKSKILSSFQDTFLPVKTPLVACTLLEILYKHKT